MTWGECQDIFCVPWVKPPEVLGRFLREDVGGMMGKLEFNMCVKDVKLFRPPRSHGEECTAEYQEQCLRSTEKMQKKPGEMKAAVNLHQLARGGETAVCEDGRSMSSSSRVTYQLKSILASKIFTFNCRKKKLRQQLSILVLQVVCCCKSSFTLLSPVANTLWFFSSIDPKFVSLSHWHTKGPAKSKPSALFSPSWPVKATLGRWDPECWKE